jgi:hypothetical protein
MPAIMPSDPMMAPPSTAKARSTAGSANAQRGEPAVTEQHAAHHQPRTIAADHVGEEELDVGNRRQQHEDDVAGHLGLDQRRRLLAKAFCSTDIITRPGIRKAV